jgi:ribosomal protein S18 acetylase RimI-like enzyme
LTTDSVYLCTLGIEPALKGKGQGSALLQRSFGVLSKQFSRVVLRTEQPNNVAFYLKNGFTLSGEHVVNASKLKLWIFSRDLDASAGAGTTR